MIFALYGRVPRLGGSQVAPVISAGSDRARVSVDFAVGGPDLHRHPTGVAHQDRRQHQRGASRAWSRRPGVRRRRGDQGCRRPSSDCVTRTSPRPWSLPQGEFARFLTATKSDRQALLRKLLDLDIYSEIRALARSREAAAEERAAQARGGGKLSRSPARMRSLWPGQRLGRLEAMADRVGDLEATVAGLEAAATAASELVLRLGADLARVDAIKPPDNLDMLDEAINRARDAFEEIEKRRDAVKTELDGRGHRVERPSLRRVAGVPCPDLSAVDRARHPHRRDRRRRCREPGRTRRWRHCRASPTPRRAVSADLASARVTHAAHALRATLVVGEPCPVCEITVAAAPDDRAGHRSHPARAGRAGGGCGRRRCRSHRSRGWPARRRPGSRPPASSSRRNGLLSARRSRAGAAGTEALHDQILKRWRRQDPDRRQAARARGCRRASWSTTRRELENGGRGVPVDRP